jgi:hypothetical protein
MTELQARTDWNRVTVEHIRQACELYDAGTAVPKRSAQSTFLLFNGRTYPGKFIRGLAYRLATGQELDPNRDYVGGVETVRFFQNLGLTTHHRGSVSGDNAASYSNATPPAVPRPAAALPENTPQPEVRRQDPQKGAVAELLRRRFGAVEKEARFPWLAVPTTGQMDGTVRAIFQALESMRGHTGFASFGKSLCCDFSVPVERLLIEYDERQHFTMQRAQALEFYPSDLSLGFDRSEWLNACHTIRATDPTPPFRDEQRAFYDSLRDILAAQNGVRLIRLRYGAFDWTGLGADDQLSAVLASAESPDVQNQIASMTRQMTVQPITRVVKVAVVSHDYNVADSDGLCDYSKHFARINKLCDEQGCDTVLYALYTWDKTSTVARIHDALFGELNHIQRVIIEVGSPPDSYDRAEIWLRGQQSPVLAHQRFATSSSSGYDKQAFIADLTGRRIADALLVLCGETNIASLVRASGEFSDPHMFADKLTKMNIRVILNPIHDYMRRYEMKEKRRYYSTNGRIVISVWNQGKGNESHTPWTIFHDGAERTGAVQELPRPFTDRPDIRIGIVDLSRF